MAVCRSVDGAPPQLIDRCQGEEDAAVYSLLERVQVCCVYIEAAELRVDWSLPQIAACGLQTFLKNTVKLGVSLVSQSCANLSL
jgi:hypothetical protein